MGSRGQVPLLCLWAFTHVVPSAGSPSPCLCALTGVAWRPPPPGASPTFPPAGVLSHSPGSLHSPPSEKPFLPHFRPMGSGHLSWVSEGAWG